MEISMNNNKLYLVTISREAYVWAASEEEALDQCSEIERWQRPDRTALRISGNILGWSKESLVYHEHQDTRDLSIGEVLEIMAEESLGKEGYA